MPCSVSSADPRLSPSVIEVNIPDDVDENPDSENQSSSDSGGLILQLPRSPHSSMGSNIDGHKPLPPLSPSPSLRNQLLRQDAVSSCSTPSEAQSPDDCLMTGEASSRLKPQWGSERLRASAPDVNQTSEPRPKSAFTWHCSQPSVFHKNGACPEEEGLLSKKAQTAPDINMFDPFPRGMSQSSVEGEGVAMHDLGGSCDDDDADEQHDLLNANTLFVPMEDGPPAHYQEAAEELDLPQDKSNLDSEGEEIEDEVFQCEIIEMDSSDEEDHHPSDDSTPSPTPEREGPTPGSPLPSSLTSSSTTALKRACSMESLHEDGEDFRLKGRNNRRHSSPFSKKPKLLDSQKSTSLDSPLLRRTQRRQDSCEGPQVAPPRAESPADLPEPLETPSTPLLMAADILDCSAQETFV